MKKYGPEYYRDYYHKNKEKINLIRKEKYRKSKGITKEENITCDKEGTVTNFFCLNLCKNICDKNKELKQ